MVTYRLAGVDGEATEEVVDTLTDSDSAYASNQDPEIKFAITRNIAEVKDGWQASIQSFTLSSRLCCPVSGDARGPQAWVLELTLELRWYLEATGSSDTESIVGPTDVFDLMPLGPQEGGLQLLLFLARAPARGSRSQPSPAGEVGASSGLAMTGQPCSGMGDWEVFALAVRLLRRACMLAANRTDLLTLKVSVSIGASRGRVMCGSNN